MTLHILNAQKKLTAHSEWLRTSLTETYERAKGQCGSLLWMLWLKLEVMSSRKKGTSDIALSPVLFMSLLILKTLHSAKMTLIT
ncbi:Uncharacterised protein [Raoultella terrigena]|uniref:Uncharacterized protein n=1 Tax=Raoultella terrigena TaxID=577 RepID=A0A3P8M2L5_RAOTE|nr:Uncharacterised protein [Raoultella terrigena]